MERDDFIEIRSRSSKVHQGGIHTLSPGVQECQLAGQSHPFQGWKEEKKHVIFFITHPQCRLSKRPGTLHLQDSLPRSGSD